MTAGKIMTPNHIIGAKAVQFIQDKILPPEWIVRPMSPHYGIDLYVELFDYENAKCVTLVEHLFLQVKGTEHPQYGTFEIKQEKINVIKFQLEVSELNLVERMGSAFPVLLVLVDLVNEVAFQICLNDYIRKILPIQNSEYRQQDTIMINIPVENKLLPDNLDALRWYGKRIKIYSMFLEMLVDIQDMDYMNDEELINHGKFFIEHYRQYDILNRDEAFLQQIKFKLDNLYENDCVSDEAILFIQDALGYTENWENGEVFEGSLWGNRGINAYLFAQKFTIQGLIENIRNYCGIFESYTREWFMPGLYFGVHNEND